MRLSISESAAFIALSAVWGNSVAFNAMSEKGKVDVAYALALLSVGDQMTSAECREQFGQGWAICPDTPANRERYKVCLTPALYRAGEARALALRAARMLNERIARK